ISALLLWNLVHLLPWCFESVRHIPFQFISWSSLLSTLEYAISFELLSSAHSGSYVIAVVMLTKDLTEQSINLSFHLGRALSLSVFMSSTLIALSEFRLFFTSLSALSFQMF